MKPSKELIKLSEANRSFQYFKQVDEGFKPYWHFHPEMEITLITEGRGVRYVGDSILPFTENQVVLVGPNLPHQWVSSVQSEAHVVQFKIDDLMEIGEMSTMDTLFQASERGLLFDYNREAIRALIDLEGKSRLSKLAGLIEVFDRLHGMNFQQLASTEYHMIHSQGFEKIQRVNQFVLENLNKKIAIREVADVAHMTRESFCRWFKRETGNTFVDFLNGT